MSRIYAKIVFLLIIILLSGCGSTLRSPIRKNEHVEIGWTPRSVLQTQTFAWFDSGYTAYAPSGELFNHIASVRDSLSFVVLYGTWCSDSQRELPRFFKIMDSLKIPSTKISLFAVDRTIQYPPGPPQQYKLTAVPTIITLYRGAEVGRIIEQPKTSIEQDLLEQLMPFTI